MRGKVKPGGGGMGGQARDSQLAPRFEFQISHACICMHAAQHNITGGRHGHGNGQWEWRMIHDSWLLIL
jgi:hypothetical protein